MKKHSISYFINYLRFYYKTISDTMLVSKLTLSGNWLITNSFVFMYNKRNDKRNFRDSDDDVKT